MKSFALLFLAGAFSMSPLLTASCGGSATTQAPGAAGAGNAGGSHSAGSAGSGTAGGGSAGAPITDKCTVDSDCTYGEISKELVKPSDCPCLYGCGYLPQTKNMQARRQAQYDKLCNPQKDGQGNGCGIDDCARPNGVTCIAGACTALVQ